MTPRDDRCDIVRGSGVCGRDRVDRAARRRNSGLLHRSSFGSKPRGYWRCASIAAPVSMSRSVTETGGANLAQSQNLRALQRSSIDAQVFKPTFSAAVSTLMPRPRLIRGRCNVDRPEAPCRAPRSAVTIWSLLEINSGVVERKQPGAAGASSGLILSDYRIDLDRQQGIDWLVIGQGVLARQALIHSVVSSSIFW